MLDKKTLFSLKVKKADKEIYKDAKKRWDLLSKPIDGLGDFEELICRIAAIQHNVDAKVSKRVAVIFCADNGVVEEKVSQSDKSVTKLVAIALGKGISSACILARSAKTTVIPVDIGIDSDSCIEGVIDMKVRKGTGNIAVEDAMTTQELLCAIEKGINLVSKLKNSGYTVISTGEMGIGNTTTSVAVLSEILGIDSDLITGKGAGLDNEGLIRKKKVIKKARNRCDFSKIKNEQERAFEILRCLGGLDIAGITGLFIGGAIEKVPVIIDGVISAAAAVAAKRLVNGCEEYMIASHKGRENGLELALKDLGLNPYIEGNMALGEGTGAIMLFPLIDMAFDFYQNASRFEDYNMDEYKRY
ncbi:nicotinate-nucleotide--dimethylbenzimidazole phosphoribosyltransferase [Butyrivibrio sp. NC3005]|uniref:nicotinate-nucleotide--dimethylbenzimidazole phosphoribosyltransferase n=1 Tax=Butyrivibrio sp. NC3005 TaxID=1280685 RepID=UPI00040A87E0|nr:nicotinate-nucleotide--dimethylbenzimidazole phosphoribosyltransferase [Butyrivibrio sp. NC3005]